MRIFVVEPDGAGGMIHYAYQLCTALAEAGAEVTMVTSRRYELAHLPAPFTVEARMRLWPVIESHRRPEGRLGAFTFRLLHRFRRAFRAVRLALAWESLTRYLLRARPDVVQFGIIRFPFQSFWLNRMERAGLALTQICHEYEPRELRLAVLQRGHQVYRSFRVIFFHSEADRDRFARLHGRPEAVTRVIPHGNETLFARTLDGGLPHLRDRYDIPASRPVALFFGGLRPSKGIEDLVDAFAIARREVEANLLIVGHPTARFPLEALRRRIAASGCAGDVALDPRYLPLEEVGALMRTTAVMVLPYRSATASGVLQVAYAFARPVIVTDAGGLPDAVEHGATGLVVPGNDTEALARALVKLLSDRRLSDSMGEAARAAVTARFSWRPIAETILDEYRRVQ